MIATLITYHLLSKMHFCFAGASIRQEHQEDGSVDVYFRAVLNAPKAGETGTLSASAYENDWSGSEDVAIEKEGENYAEVKVSLTPLCQASCYLQIQVFSASSLSISFLSCLVSHK